MVGLEHVPDSLHKLIKTKTAKKLQPFYQMTKLISC